MKENLAQLRRDDTLEQHGQELGENALRLSLRQYIEGAFSNHAELKKVGEYVNKGDEEGKNLFFDELLKFIEAKRKGGKIFERRRLRAFTELLSSEVFSLPQEIRDSISSDDLIITTARMTRVPETGGWLGHHMVGEVIRRLQTGDLDTDGLIEKTRQRPVSEIIDLIDCLRTVAIGSGGFEEKLTTPVKQKVDQLIQRLADEHQCAFVDCAASIGLADTTNERSQFVDAEQPGRRFGKRKAGATAEELVVIDKVETIQLSHQIVPNIRINPADRLSRISSDAVAVLDNTQTARAYGYFDPKEETKKQSVKFIDYEDMAGDERANPFSKQDTDLPLLLQHLHNPAMRRRIENDLGISLRELPLRAQVRLLEFLAEPHSDRFERLQRVLQKHPEAGNDILMSFLSCAEDKSYGEAVLTLAEILPPEIAKRVFSKYAEIVGTTENIAGYIREQFGKDADEAEVIKTTQNILHRGNELLKRSSEQADDSDDLMNQLEEIQSDIVLFASSFKTLFKNKEAVDFSEVRGLDFQRQPIEWLSDKDKSEMLAIAKANWSPRGKAGEGVLSEFGETLRHGKDIDFYVLRREGKIISFVRFDAPTPDGHRYSGSFNVDQQYRGSAIGEAMIYNALDKQAEQYVLDATVYPKLDVGTKYVEQTGFAITNVLHNYDNSGEDFFEITCDRRKNKKFVSREAKKETLMALATSDGQNWRELVGHNLIVLKFDSEKEHQQVVDATEGLIAEGYVGTRYFADLSDKKKRYYVFELDKEEKQKERLAA